MLLSALLLGSQTADGDEVKAEIPNLGEHPMEGGLILDGPGDHRLLGLAF
jgi:hypothetical protein